MFTKEDKYNSKNLTNQSKYYVLYIIAYEVCIAYASNEIYIQYKNNELHKYVFIFSHLTLTLSGCFNKLYKPTLTGQSKLLNF